ncbi:MAG: carboxypeptidase regulatory-like domain-containing protein [Acidobacteria bacterium]|nr:carboxypeptidase regulatory-like domain-containing protein [Acidobacteriota bacterium]
MSQVDTGLSRTLVSDDAGVYRATQLEVGNYEVKAELAGFQTSIRRGIQRALSGTFDIRTEEKIC